MSDNAKRAAERPAGGVAALPPTGNTGGKLTLEESSAHLDNLRGTLPAENVSAVIDLLAKHFGRPELTDARVSAWYPDGGYRWEDVPSLLIGLNVERGDALLIVPGKACDHLGGAGVLELVHLLAELAFNCTRADPAYDDVDGLVPMDEVHAAGQAGQYLGFRKYRDCREWDLGELTGDTAYFGARGKDGGGQYLRFYNKTLESGGQVVGPGGRHVTRVELELGKVGKRSQQFFAAMAECQDVEQLTRVISEAVGGVISFVEREGAHGHTDRMRVRAWWLQLRQLLGATRYQAVRRVARLVETIQHLRRSCIKSLAKVRAAANEKCGLGWEFVRALVDAGAEKCDPHKLVGLAAELPDWLVREVMGGRGGAGPQAERGRAAPTLRWA